jgi:hypothetical protein
MYQEMLRASENWQRWYDTQIEFGPLHRTIKALRQKSNFLNNFSLIWVVQFARQK